MHQGTTSCFSFIVSVIFAFLLLIPSLLVFNYKINPPMLIKILVGLFVVLMSVFIVNEYSVFFTESVNPSTPKWFIASLILISVIYPSVKGIEAVSRCAFIFSFFVSFSIILILALIPYGDFSYFNLPDNSLYLSQSIGVLLIFSPFVLCNIFTQNIKSNSLKTILIPFIVTAIIFLVINLFSKLLSIAEYHNLFYTLSEVSCKFMPMGLSGLFIAFSLICVFFTLSYFSIAVKNIFNYNNSGKSVVFLLLVFIVSLITMYFENLSSIILNKYFLAALYIAVSVIIPIYLAYKGKNYDS
jgi:hypothetical protein